MSENLTEVPKNDFAKRDEARVLAIQVARDEFGLGFCDPMQIAINGYPEGYAQRLQELTKEFLSQQEAQ